MRSLACSSKTDSKEGAPPLVSLQRAIHGCTAYCISRVLTTSRRFPMCCKIARSNGVSSSSPARSLRSSTSRRKAISRAPCMLQYTSARSILNVSLTKLPNAISLPLCYEVSCQVGRHNPRERETRFIFKSKARATLRA